MWEWQQYIQDEEDFQIFSAKIKIKIAEIELKLKTLDIPELEKQELLLTLKLLKEELNSVDNNDFLKKVIVSGLIFISFIFFISFLLSFVLLV